MYITSTDSCTSLVQIHVSLVQTHVLTSTDTCLTSTDTYTCTSLVQIHVLTSTLCFTHASKSMSLFLGTSSAGNRSPISPMNIGTSSVTIFGVLKSLNALINTYTHTTN